MNTVEFWSGEFGDEYVDRNRVDWQKREHFWRGVMPKDARTVLEVGCNIGSNLKAIRSACDLHPVGVDVNEKALLEAAGAGFEVHRMPAADIAERLGVGSFDVVFTAGVLIHIAPEDLDRVMAAIVAASKRYVIAVEYAHPEETHVTYRGHEGKLWKRPYGQLYQALGLTLDGFGFVGHGEGFDNCAWWRLTK
jgi:pseudaminic acid biosynthesis-associated methylase